MADTSSFPTIDAYLQSFPEGTRSVLEQLRQIIHRAAPDVVETMRYGIPTFDHNGKHLIFLAAWKRHIALYPLPAGDPALQRDMAPYRHIQKAKSAIHFPLGEPIPHDLVARVVRFRIEETEHPPEQPAQ